MSTLVMVFNGEDLAVPDTRTEEKVRRDFGRVKQSLGKPILNMKD